MRQSSKSFVVSLVVAAAVVATATASSSCSRCLGGTSLSSGTSCDTSGSATLAVAPGLSSSKPLHVWNGLSCFSGATCSPGLILNIRDTTGDTSPGFDMTIALPPTMGSFTTTLSSATGDWSPNGPGVAPLEPLAFVSGTVEVHDANEAGFTAMFALEFRTAAGDRVSVTGGQATVSNCHVVQGCGE
jgi:hypothetical protein